MPGAGVVHHINSRSKPIRIILISLTVSRICGVPGDYNLEFLELLAVYEIDGVRQACWRVEPGSRDRAASLLQTRPCRRDQECGGWSISGGQLGGINMKRIAAQILDRRNVDLVQKRSTLAHVWETGRHARDCHDR
jgi:hypothetical protein